MENKASITALMSAFGRAWHIEHEENPIFADYKAKALLTDEEYKMMSTYIHSGIDFFQQKANIMLQLSSDGEECERMREELKEDIKAYNERYYKIRKSIEKLPVAQYDLIFSMYVLGQTLQEVANHAELSYSWAKTTHKRAIEALQKMIDEKEEAHAFQTENMGLTDK